MRYLRPFHDHLHENPNRTPSVVGMDRNSYAWHQRWQNFFSMNRSTKHVNIDYKAFESIVTFDLVEMTMKVMDDYFQGPPEERKLWSKVSRYRTKDPESHASWNQSAS